MLIPRRFSRPRHTSIHIKFHDSHLFENIRQAGTAIDIKGVNKESELIRADKIGEFRDLSKVYYYPNAGADILSFIEIARINEVTRDKQAVSFRVLSSNNYNFIFL